MKLGYFFDQVKKFGIDKDPRGKKSVKSFEDSAILWGSRLTEVKKILVGIDIEVAELLLADKLRSQEGLDMVLSHHPEGRAWAGFYEVMRLQVDLLKGFGVCEKLAKELVEARKDEVARKVLANNHMRSVDAAKILDMPFVCAHTPADNQVADFLQRLMDKIRPSKVKDIVDLLMGIPEYQDADACLAGPRIVLGNPNRPAGKIFVEMTGGTEGPKEAFDKLYSAGVRTLVSMHLSEEHFKKVKDANLNVVVAGHISSDTLGLNLLLDRIEKEAKEKLHTIQCSGFRRIRRN